MTSVQQRDGAGPLERRMMALHAGLRELFFRHQQALLDRDLERARGWLTTFAKALRAHANDEEEYVLPVYAARGGDASDSPAAQFRTEHRKMLAFVDELEARLERLVDVPDDRALLEILDRESWFKSLLEHHDVREGRALYPKLSAWLSGEEQEAVLARVGLPRIVVEQQG